jgi:hypothetical protein
MACVVQNDVCWEVQDNYQKQTFRNRCHICTDAGRHILTIPVQHVGGKQGRQMYRDVRVDNDYQWQRQHWRTLQTAYRSSPYFEFYEDDLAFLFEKPFDFLLDFNLASIEFICDCLQWDTPKQKTKKYELETQHYQDVRFLVKAKQNVVFEQESYVQVFGDRHGFIPNTSALDLLFNEGTNALAYLQNQKLDFLNA